MGYPAVMITDTAFYRNPNYHTATDTIDTLDFDKMTDLLKGLIQAAKDLTDSSLP
jgi:aminopeptidase-like protein